MSKKKAPSKKPSPAKTPSADSKRLVGRLAQIGLFGGLSKKELAGLIPVTQWRKASAGETIFKEGDTDNAIFLIEKGKVVISINKRGGGSQDIAILSDGDFFGEMSFLEAKPRSASARTIDDALLVVIEGNRLLKWVGAKPRLALTIGMNVVRTMSERLRQTTQELTRFHSLVESFLAAKTKEEVVEGLAQELQRIVTPEVASGAMVYAYNPFIEEFASLKHWGQVPGDLLMSRKELPHDSPQCRRFPLGLSEKDGCLVLIDPRERHLLKKIPVIQTFAWIAYQTLKNVEARLEEELKSRMKSTSISS